MKVKKRDVPVKTVNIKKGIFTPTKSENYVQEKKNPFLIDLICVSKYKAVKPTFTFIYIHKQALPGSSLFSQ